MENEIELAELFSVIRKRKWLIILPALLLMFLAGLYSFLKTPLWKVEAVIKPASMTSQTAAGTFQEAAVVPLDQLIDKINDRFHAEIINSTQKIRVWTESTNIQKAKKDQMALFTRMKSDLDQKAEEIADKVEKEIKACRMKKALVQGEIDSLKNKLKILEKRTEEIEREIKRNSSLSSTAHLQYLHNLKESLSQRKLEAEDMKRQIAVERNKINQIDMEINGLHQKKSNIKLTQLVKKPEPSSDPVSPQTALNIFIAGFFGFFIFTAAALWMEYIRSRKSKISKK